MFKKDNLETPPDKVNTIIGKDASLKGTINCKGLIRIDGLAEGTISNKGDVVIGEGGRVKADLEGRNITIAGNYEGTLVAEGRLEIKKTATVVGVLKANTLLVEDGAVMTGSMEMKHKEQAGTQALTRELNNKAAVSE